MANPLKDSFMAHMRWAWYVTGACFTKPEEGAMPRRPQHWVSMILNVFGWLAWPICLVLQCLRAIGDSAFMAYLYVHSEHAIALEDWTLLEEWTQKKWRWLGLLCFRSTKVPYIPPLPYRLGWLLWFAVGSPIMLTSLCWGFVIVSLQCVFYGIHWGMVWGCAGDKTWWRVAKGRLPWSAVLGLIPGMLLGFVFGIVVANLKAFVDAFTASALRLSAFSYDKNRWSPTRLAWGRLYGRWLYAFPGAVVGGLLGVLVGWLSHMLHSAEIYFKQAHALFANMAKEQMDRAMARRSDETLSQAKQTFGWSMVWEPDPRTEFKVLGAPIASLFTFFIVIPAWVLGAVTGWLRMNVQFFCLSAAWVLQVWPYPSTDRELAHWGDMKNKPVMTAITGSPGMLLGLITGAVFCLVTAVVVYTGLYDFLWLTTWGLQFGLDRQWMHRGAGHYWRACLKEPSWPLRIPGLLVGSIVGGVLVLGLTALRSTKYLFFFTMRLIRFIIGAFLSLFTSAPPLDAGDLTDHFDWRGRLHQQKVSSEAMRKATRGRRALFHLNPVGESVAEQSAVYLHQLSSQSGGDGQSKSAVSVTTSDVVKALALVDPWVTSRYERAYVACEVRRVLDALLNEKEGGEEPPGASLGYVSFFKECLWATGQDEWPTSASP